MGDVARIATTEVALLWMDGHASAEAPVAAQRARGYGIDRPRAARGAPGAALEVKRLGADWRGAGRDNVEKSPRARMQPH